MTDAFRNQYQGEFKPPALEDLIWMLREFVCERFDRTACTGPIGPYGIMPASPQERSVCEIHARGVARAAKQLGGGTPLKRGQVRLSFEELGKVAAEYEDVCDRLVIAGREALQNHWPR